MFLRPLKLTAGEIPHPAAGVTQLLAFLQKKFCSPLFLVAQRVIDGQRNLIRNQ